MGKTSNASLQNNTNNSVETSFGYTESMRENIVSDTLPKIFGSEFFLNPKISLEPALNLATPKNYQLGPGDQFMLRYNYSGTNNVGFIFDIGEHFQNNLKEYYPQVLKKSLKRIFRE